MFSDPEACCTKYHILTDNTFIDCFCVLDFSKLTPITIVKELFAYFPIVFALNMFILFLLELSQILGGFSISTKGTLDDSISRILMFGPLSKTLEMEYVETL